MAFQKRDLVTPDEMLRWGPDVGNLLIGHGGAHALSSPLQSAVRPAEKKKPKNHRGPWLGNVRQRASVAWLKEATRVC
ncbi:hypothetical protein HLV37_03775 [Eggerthellaceae bacterium zg-1084]|uniref:hypothetical protein n=1 Tax=Berryella wangjianweii TaxID=2734634 RepID=UPI001553D824|nr:hypothetical protein [Berryella wangjianweii]NPD30987.1 hypothetical protein [Berryella wangjianweii]NPD31852.1 hypothetical protein [Eggerthellaceae bacterium zg-997]